MSKRFYYPNMEINMNKISRSIKYTMSITTGSDVYFRIKDNGQLFKASTLKLRCGVSIYDSDDRHFLIYHSKGEWWIRAYPFKGSALKEFPLKELKVK